jgi:hypothetical protein
LLHGVEFGIAKAGFGANSPSGRFPVRGYDQLSHGFVDETVHSILPRMPANEKRYGSATSASSP